MSDTIIHPHTTVEDTRWFNIDYRQTDEAGTPLKHGYTLSFPVTDPHARPHTDQDIRFFTTTPDDGSECIGFKGYVYSDGLGCSDDANALACIGEFSYAATIRTVDVRLEFTSVKDCADTATLTHLWPGKEPYVRHFVHDGGPT